jgi:hypothetical protein
MDARIHKLLRARPPALVDRGLLSASGSDVPADGTDGWQTSAIFQHTDGGAGTALYVNEGTVTSSAFKPINPTLLDTLQGSGTTVPTDGATGWDTGAIFQHTDGGADDALYVNDGSSSSADFNPLKTRETSLGEGTTVPVDATAGWDTGAIFQHTDGGVDDSLYVNEGSSVSSDFNPLKTRVTTLGEGTTVPADATAGWDTGAIFQHTDGGVGTALYVNEGSSVSSDFNPLKVGAIFPTWSENADNWSDLKAAFIDRWPQHISTTSNLVKTFGTLTGSLQYFAAVAAPNGYIYFVPNQATAVLKLDPSDDSTSTFGSFGAGGKWIGGVLAPNGKIYGIPHAGTEVLAIDTSDDSVATFGTLAGSNKWGGGVLSNDGYIYGIPYASTTVLKIDPSDNSTSTFGSLAGSSKWLGGALAPNGNIYGIPNASTAVLKIDTSNDTTSTFGSLGAGNKWTGGCLALNGCIYGVPFDATTVCKIDPSDDTVTVFGSIAGGDKYYGGAIGPNGYIYCVPFDAANVLRIDPMKESAQTIGSAPGTDAYTGAALASNGWIYCAQNSATTICKIQCTTETVDAGFYLSRHFTPGL